MSYEDDVLKEIEDLEKAKQRVRFDDQEFWDEERLEKLSKEI